LIREDELFFTVIAMQVVLYGNCDGCLRVMCVERRALQYWSTYSRPRLALHTVTSSKYFDLAISAVIGINVVTMAMEYYMMPQVCVRWSPDATCIYVTGCNCEKFFD